MSRHDSETSPSQTIPTKSFYSAKKTKRQLEIEDKLDCGESELKKKPLPQVLKSGLWGPPTDWKIFFKQDEALKYAKEKENNLMTFAYEERVPNSQGR